VRVTIATEIADAVETALRSKFPRRLIMTKRIIDSSMRLAERPLTENYSNEIDAALGRSRREACEVTGGDLMRPIEQRADFRSYVVGPVNDLATTIWSE
jgi:hypothetical protein